MSWQSFFWRIGSTVGYLYLFVSVAEFGSPALAELNTFFKQYVEKYK